MFFPQLTLTSYLLLLCTLHREEMEGRELERNSQSLTVSEENQDSNPGRQTTEFFLSPLHCMKPRKCQPHAWPSHSSLSSFQVSAGCLMAQVLCAVTVSSNHFGGFFRSCVNIMREDTQEISNPGAPEWLSWSNL